MCAGANETERAEGKWGSGVASRTGRYTTTIFRQREKKNTKNKIKYYIKGEPNRIRYERLDAAIAIVKGAYFVGFSIHISVHIEIFRDFLLNT